MRRAPHPRIISGESRRSEEFPLDCRERHCLGRRPRPRRVHGPVQPAAPVGHRQVHLVRRVRRPRPGDARRDQDGRLHHPSSSRRPGVQPGGDVVNGQRSWTQAVPLLKSEIVAAPHVTITDTGRPMRLTQGDEIAVRAPLNGAEPGQSRQRAAGLRRLRSHRARAQLGRFQGSGRPRQDPRRADQRPRLRRRRRRFRRQGDDLLRPLDLQI